MGIDRACGLGEDGGGRGREDGASAGGREEGKGEKGKKDARRLVTKQTSSRLSNPCHGGVGPVRSRVADEDGRARVRLSRIGVVGPRSLVDALRDRGEDGNVEVGAVGGDLDGGVGDVGRVGGVDDGSVRRKT
jgi:hypothetical protein